MYEEYPDLIYEGILYDLDNSFDIIEEGNFSPKSIFKKIINILKKLYVHIKQTTRSIKNKFMQFITKIKDIICKKYTLDLKLYNNILHSFSVNFMQSVKLYEKKYNNFLII